MSLSWRLVLSYGVIILITLVLAFGVLIIISRPLQNRLVQARLNSQVQLAKRQLNSLFDRGTTLEQIVMQLANRPRLGGNDIQLLLVDLQGNVVFDVQDRLNGEYLALPERAGDIVPSGSFRAPDGQPVNYAAAVVGPAGEAQAYAVIIAPRTPPIPRAISELGSGFLTTGVVALLISLLLSVLVARSISLPLKAIADATAAIAAGDYAHRVPEKGPREVKKVATSFNLMAGQVEASQQAMRDFVSNVSHELKTPLTSIQGFSQAILEGATPDRATTQQAARIIHEEAGRMSRLVEDLLDLARIDSGQVIMQKEALDLEQILLETVRRLLPQAIENNITLEKRWTALPNIVGDGDRLAQVFTNLVDNAIRHTPPGGQVVVGATIVQNLPRPRTARSRQLLENDTSARSERGDFVEVSISDTGAGIAADDLTRIFERFYQVDKSRSRGQGTGLGLAIIKEIVDAHSGHIRAESEGGEGTKFVVLLPVTEADAQTLISIRSA
jgi:signal transduction histidine kinase